MCPNLGVTVKEVMEDREADMARQVGGASVVEVEMPTVIAVAVAAAAMEVLEILIIVKAVEVAFPKEAEVGMAEGMEAFRVESEQVEAIQESRREATVGGPHTIGAAIVDPEGGTASHHLTTTSEQLSIRKVSASRSAIDECQDDKPDILPMSYSWAP